MLGSPVTHPEDALVVARRALELGFTSTVGILHDHEGQLQPLGEHQQKIFADHADGQALVRALQPFSKKHCPRRAATNGDAAPAAVISTFAKTAWCIIARSSAASRPSHSRQYTREHLAHEYHTKKTCAPHCTISCVQQVAMLDNWRDPQTREGFRKPVRDLVQLPTTAEDES